MAGAPWMMQNAYQRIHTIMQSAVARGHIKTNPAEGIRSEMPKTKAKTRHHDFIPYSDVGHALELLEGSNRMGATVKLSIKFLVLTAARSAEIRGATWDDIDIETATWIIPDDKIKTGVSHRIPLSTAGNGRPEGRQDIRQRQPWRVRVP